MTKLRRLLLAVMLGLGISHTAFAVLPDFIQIIKDNTASVVNISTAQEVQSRTPAPGMPQLPDNDPLNEFFKRFFNAPRDGKQTLRSLGSGFVISQDGYILTNAHVVKNADEIVVRLGNAREEKAELVGIDEQSDIALLKIDAKGLPTVKIGNSDELEQGQWVVAIGSPFGFDHSATEGIVSALRRSLPNDTYVPFIQTDVALNPGNSGGPLFDTQGKVVGINSQIYSNTGGYMGLSFTIPINLAMRVAEQLKTQGHVTRGWLGVTIQPVDQNLTEAFGLKQPVGALVSEVVNAGPAAAAGIQAGDIITRFDHKPVHDAYQLPAMVAASAVGDAVPVEVIREGKTLVLSVKIARLDDAENKTADAEQVSRLKLVVADLDDSQRRDLKVDSGGVLVKKVLEGPGKSAGVRNGDVIMALDRKPIDSAAVLTRLARNLPVDKPVPLLIQRAGNAIFLPLTLPSKQ